MASQHIPVTGKCLCGAVRFESKEPPFEGVYCHCTICQRAWGGLYGAALRIPGSGFRFTKGEPKHYRATNFAKRGFCGECGSPLTFDYEGISDVWILIGSLDHPEDWPMTKDASWGQSHHNDVEFKVPWEEINDGVPHSTSASKVAVKAAKEYVASMSKKGGD